MKEDLMHLMFINGVNMKAPHPPQVIYIIRKIPIKIPLAFCKNVYNSKLIWNSK